MLQYYIHFVRKKEVYFITFIIVYFTPNYMCITQITLEGTIFFYKCVSTKKLMRECHSSLTSEDNETHRYWIVTVVDEEFLETHFETCRRDRLRNEVVVVELEKLNQKIE